MAQPSFSMGSRGMPRYIMLACLPTHNDAVRPTLDGRSHNISLVATDSSSSSVREQRGALEQI